MRVLLVKMSSLGDVVHTLPAVSDAAAHGARFHWVVEEAFADVAARHPAVDAVLPIAWRRWRGRLMSSRGELRAFYRRLRAEAYDLVLDAQGLVKSGVVTALARARDKAGLSRHSAREGAAALFYRRQIPVARGDHAVDRLRRLFAGALGYALDPAARLDFGLSPGPAPTGPPTCVLLHGTTWASKHWPEPLWVELARLARASGFAVRVPWGTPREQARARRIALGEAEVWDRTPLGDLIERLSAATLVVGVDSGLSHLSAALGVPTVVIYGSTNAVLTGCRGERVINLQAEFPCAPCLARHCAYRGPAQHWEGVLVEPACYSRVTPEQVWQAALERVNADRVLHL